MEWLSPTGYIDAGGAWYNETNAYDDILGTYAGTTSSVEYLELLHEAILCSKVRIYENCYYRDKDIDVFYEGAYHNIYSGRPTRAVWTEIEIPGGPKIVTRARIKSNEAAGNTVCVHEFDFGKVEPPPPVGRSSGYIIG